MLRNSVNYEKSLTSHQKRLSDLLGSGLNEEKVDNLKSKASGLGLHPEFATEVIDSSGKVNAWLLSFVKK